MRRQVKLFYLVIFTQFFLKKVKLFLRNLEVQQVQFEVIFRSRESKILKKLKR